MKTTEKMLAENLKFIALYVAMYESLEDYILECPKQLLGRNAMFREDCIDEIRKQEQIHREAKENARNFLLSADKSTIDKKMLDELETLAEYNYIKELENGYVQWLEPDYDRLINKRLLVFDGKKQKKPSKLYNSVIFFVDSGIIEQTDFEDFRAIRDLRNDFVHEMSKFIIREIEDRYRRLFDKLVELYIKINNYWSVEFELSIGGDDIPTDMVVDYENVITVDLYNLLLSIDILHKTKFVTTKTWVNYTGLYDCLMLPEK